MVLNLESFVSLRDARHCLSTSDGHNWEEGAAGIQHAEARDVVNTLQGRRTAPRRLVICPKMSAEPGLRKKSCHRELGMLGLSQALTTYPGETKQRRSIH